MTRKTKADLEVEIKILQDENRNIRGWLKERVLTAKAYAFNDGYKKADKRWKFDLIGLLQKNLLVVSKRELEAVMKEHK